MADNGVLVTISGAALSLLLYENVRSTGDQMGLLLGNVLTFVTKNVTDGERQVEHVKNHINIDTVFITPKDILRDGLGRIDTEKLETLTKKEEKRIIGWFRFRRHDILQPTLRDKIIHKEYASHFLKYTGASAEHFIMFLLNASTTSHSRSTHKYRHVCFQYKQRTFQTVPLKINNLGADTARHDGSDYKPVPVKSPDTSDVFTELVEKLPLNPSNFTSIGAVTAIQARAEQYLRSLTAQVCKSDEEISELQKQVNELRARVQKSTWIKNNRQREKAAEQKYITENDRVCTTAQIHGSPRSTHSDDLFDSNQSPNVSAILSNPNSHMTTKIVNTERTKQFRHHSSSEFDSHELLRSGSSPESTRSKESTPKYTNKVNIEEKFTRSKNSPKNTGKKVDRHSLGDFGDHNQEETSPLGKKEQSSRPTSYSENR